MRNSPSWNFDERLKLLEQIARASAREQPVAAVMAISEANRMLESGPGEQDDRQADRNETQMPMNFTPATLAERWGCSHRHVRNLINEGRLEAFRLGGKLVRISADAVLAYELEETMPGSIEPPDRHQLMQKRSEQLRPGASDPLQRARIQHLLQRKPAHS